MLSLWNILLIRSKQSTNANGIRDEMKLNTSKNSETLNDIDKLDDYDRLNTSRMDVTK